MLTIINVIIMDNSSKSVVHQLFKYTPFYVINWFKKALRSPYFTWTGRNALKYLKIWTNPVKLA